MCKSTDKVTTRSHRLRRAAMFAVHVIVALLGLILVLFASHCVIDWAHGARA